MKPTFDISLPSIPGKCIKFKIQDIKNSAFGSKKSRFNENKRILTKKFIESFHNFHQKPLVEQTQTQASQSRLASGSTSFTIHKDTPIQFRYMIPQQKKHMIELCQNYQKELQKKEQDQKNNIKKNIKNIKAYTFAKTEKYNKNNNQNDEDENEYYGNQTTNTGYNNNGYNNVTTRNNTSNISKNNQGRKFVTDNYYFTSTRLNNMFDEEKDIITKNKFVNVNIDNHDKKKRQRQNAVFKAETREKIYSKVYDNQVPGPGAYVVKGQIDMIKQAAIKKRVNSLHHATSMSHAAQSSQLQYKKLKSLISQIVKQPQPYQTQQQQQQQQPSFSKKPTSSQPQYMFIQDDRDRFGKQRFPISFRLNVPGPGTYEVGGDIEEQAKKVMLIEEQRRLLKEWFNN